MRRLASSVVLAVVTIASIGVATPAYAISPPCRMTPHEYRQVRVTANHRLGMTRRFVKQMVGCGGKVVDYQSNSRDTLRTVAYQRTTPAGTTARIIYFDDRVDLKCTGPHEDCAGALAPDARL